MNENSCPCCHNHCSKDHLGCNRGKEYFDAKNNKEPKAIDDMIIGDLRRCGHMIHHNQEIDSNKFLSVLSNEEKKLLHELLKKISKEA